MPLTQPSLFESREIYRFTDKEDRSLIQLEQMFSGGRALTQAEWWHFKEACRKARGRIRRRQKRKNLTFSREVLVRPQELESWTL